MKRMKHVLVAVCAVALVAAFALVGCSSGSGSSSAAASSAASGSATSSAAASTSASASSAAASGEAVQLQIFAANSLSKAMAEAQELYTKNNPGNMEMAKRIAAAVTE